MQVLEKMEKYDAYNLTRIKGRWFNIIVANVLAGTFILLGLLTPVLSLALAFIVMAYMQIGIQGFVLKAYKNSTIEYESIFMPLKSIIKILCVKIIAMAGMLIWGILLIVPGIIYGLNTAFCGLILFENPQMPIDKIFAESKRLTFGKRGEIFLIALSMLAIVCTAASIGVGVHYLLSLMFVVPWFLTMIVILLPSLICLVCLALPTFELYLVAAYEDSKQKIAAETAPKSKKQH